MENENKMRVLREIIEQGNHAELLKQKGKYYKLYTLQYHKEKLSGK